MRRAPPATAQNRPDFAMSDMRAVLDIGSNSVRLVIYDGPPRAPYAICNEKRICGLGRGVETTGALAEAAVVRALDALRRFRFLLDEIGVARLRSVATAAVREAANGPEFLARARALGFEIEILSGDREAQLAAGGVMLADPFANGLVGDLGGGSLELVETRYATGAGRRASARLGPLWVIEEARKQAAVEQKLIDQRLDEIDWLSDHKAQRLYLVGGAWRHLARVHMILKDHPLSILHNYQTPHTEMIEVCQVVKGLTTESLERLPEIPRRRQEFLPYAAMLLESILVRLGGVESVIVSAAGVREGVLYEELSPGERAKDPLIEACCDYAARATPDPEFGAAAEAFINPLFGEESPRAARLRRTACLLSEIGADAHPEYRALHAYNTVISGPWAAIGHAERVFLALCLFFRYGGRGGALDAPEIEALLSPEDRQRARVLGAALRLAGAIAPRAPGVLKQCRLTTSDGALILRLDRVGGHGGDILGENVRKRLAALADLLGLRPDPSARPDANAFPG